MMPREILYTLRKFVPMSNVSSAAGTNCVSDNDPICVILPSESILKNVNPLNPPAIAPRIDPAENFNGPVMVREPSNFTNVSISCWMFAIVSSMVSSQLLFTTFVPTLSRVRSTTHNRLRWTLVLSDAFICSCMIKSCRFISMIFSLKYPEVATVAKSSVVL